VTSRTRRGHGSDDQEVDTKAEKHTRKVSVFSWGAVEPALIKSLLVAVYTDRGQVDDLDR